MFTQSDNDNNFDDDSVERIDQFCRYAEEIDKSKYKVIYKAFNELQGIDVAWQKINLASLQLPIEQIKQLVEPTEIGLELDHPNITKCYKCWFNETDKILNIISELFTSGNLRQYRRQHQKLELKAVKKFSKQLLKGLSYLHAKNIIHGDIRPGKIYVNGHSGEVKIGDIGLTQIPLNVVEPLRSNSNIRRAIQIQENQSNLQNQLQKLQGQLSIMEYQNQGQVIGQIKNSNESNKTLSSQNTTNSTQFQQNQKLNTYFQTPSQQRNKTQFNEDKSLPSWDIFCFGLCMLELITLEQQDFNVEQPYLYLDTLEKLQDKATLEFISQCFSAQANRPSADSLLANVYLKVAPSTQASTRKTNHRDQNCLSPNNSSSLRQGAGPQGMTHPKSSHELSVQASEELNRNQSGAQDQNQFSKIGVIRGEDYNFEFSACQEEGQINFRLVMRPDESLRSEQERSGQSSRSTKIDFVFNPSEDTADGLAQEMAQQFDLSVTDMEICAAAIKEWLARELPDQEDQEV